MDISPKTLREVEFREKWRGYHPEDVDTFLESAAEGVETLQNQLRQATERVAHAEQLAAASGTNDEALSRTLLLAQRTADMAVEEAQEQAARVVAAAEAQAQVIVAEASQAAQRTAIEAQVALRAQLAELEQARRQLQDDVEVLQQWMAHHRSSLSMSLGNLLEQLQADLVVDSAAPAVTDVEVPPNQAAVADPRANDNDADAGDTALDAGPRDEDSAGDAADLHGAERYDGAGSDGIDVESPDLGGADLGGADLGGADLDDSEGGGGEDGPALPEERAESVGAVEGAHLDEPVEAAAAGDDDPFMTELRRAVTDTEPLGPRDEDSEPGQELPHASLQEDLDAKRFGSRLRRRR